MHLRAAGAVAVAGCVLGGGLFLAGRLWGIHEAGARAAAAVAERQAAEARIAGEIAAEEARDARGQTFREAVERAKASEASARASWEEMERPRGSRVTPRPFRDESAARGWVAAAKVARDEGAEDRARECWLRAVACDPGCAEAQAALGRVRYEKPQDEVWETLELEGLAEVVVERHGRWADPATAAAWKAEEAAIRSAGEAELAHRAADPAYARLTQLRRAVRAQPALAGCTFEDRYLPPFLIFGQTPEAPGAARDLVRLVSLFRAAHERFARECAAPLELRVAGADPLVVLAFRDRPAFDDFNRSRMPGLSSDTEAYYDLDLGYAVLHQGPVAGGVPRYPGFADEAAYKIATYQLVDACVNRGREGEQRLAQSRWCRGGFAEWFGSIRAAPPDDGPPRWEPSGPTRRLLGLMAEWTALGPSSELAVLLRRVDPARAEARLAGLRGPLPIRDLVRCHTSRAFRGMLAERAGLGASGEIALRELEPMYLQAQAGCVFHFCLGRDDLRPRLEAYMRWEWGLDPDEPPVTMADLRASLKADGRSTTAAAALDPATRCAAAFARAFAGVDLDAFDRDFRAWLDAQIRGEGK